MGMNICVVQNSNIPDLAIIGLVQGGRACPRISSLVHSSTPLLLSPSTTYPQMNDHTPPVTFEDHPLNVNCAITCPDHDEVVQATSRSPEEGYTIRTPMLVEDMGSHESIIAEFS
jgi:hypothetical protein